VLATLAANSVFNVLDRTVVDRRELAFGRPQAIDGPGGPTGITVEAFAVPGKIALYLEDAAKGANYGSTAGDTIGLKVTATGSDKAFYYVPGCAEVDAALAARLNGASRVFFDGTLYTDDEMIRMRAGVKTGRRMGHVPVSGEGGSLAFLSGLPGRKIYVHINTTNPILIHGSDEHRAVRDAGVEIGWDGMEITL
jgi:pyrroloquinoline quinone biosynthesis protein B